MPQESKARIEHEGRLRAFVSEFETESAADYAKLHICALPIAQTSIAYYEFGDPAGRPLLCLHGLSISGLFFEAYHAYFMELGVRAIAPCLLGGVYIADANKTIDCLGAELIELLDLLQVRTFDIIGFSWGTLPQLALMARAPERIGKSGLLGAMTPLAFTDPARVKDLKSDVRTTLSMAGRMPLLHRCLMWLVCKLPITALVGQFKDASISAAEVAALAPATPFYRHFTRCMAECMRTGSRFYTDGWRMFLDEPAYALSDLAAAGKTIDVRLYVASQDNVHLPYFSALLASACSGVALGEVSRKMARVPVRQRDEVFGQVYAQDNCSAWMVEGAGRMACMLYFKEALANLLETLPAGVRRKVG